MPKQAKKPASNRGKPGRVPLGSGMASRARGLLSGRGRQVDEIVERQVKRR